MSSIVTKNCPSCKTKKHVSEFYKNKSKADGLTIQCKVCTKRMHHETYLRHKDDIIAKTNIWRANNQEKIDVARREWKRRWRLENPGRNNAWRNEKPNKVREYNQSRRVRLLGDRNKITSKEWAALLDFYGHKCLCCGKPEEDTLLTLDHVIPISKGGANVIENAQPLCLSCNSKKHTKTIDYRI